MSELLEPHDVEEIDLASVIAPIEHVELEPIDYSGLTTDDLCAAWLAIPPDDVRRGERMAEVARCLSGKVDRLDEIHAMSQANAKAFDAMAASFHERYVEPLETKADQERNRAAGIESLLLFVMKKNDLVELDGAIVRAKLKVNTSNPATIWKREPTSVDMARYGESFVRPIPSRYEWEKSNVKKAIMEKQLPDFDAVELRAKESIKFEVVVNVQAIPPKRKKVKA